MNKTFKTPGTFSWIFKILIIWELGGGFFNSTLGKLTEPTDEPVFKYLN